MIVKVMNGGLFRVTDENEIRLYCPYSEHSYCGMNCPQFEVYEGTGVKLHCTGAEHQMEPNTPPWSTKCEGC
jgi:hypothetical protein